MVSTVVRRVATSGWVPAALVLATAVALMLTNQVPVHDAAAFLGYVAFFLVIPGLVLWRLLVPHTGAPLLADAVFGTALALSAELAAYITLGHFDHPGLAKLWVLLPLLACLVPRWRSRVWRRSAPQPAWWSWTMGAITAFALVVLKQVAWDVAPVSPERLRNPYVDFPYHLALVTALGKHVRPDLPFLAGEPLYYHWFDHAHVAAERHVTGIDPVLLIMRLDMLIPVLVVLLGSAMLAHRVARSPLAGVVAIGALTMGGSMLIWPLQTPLFLVSSTYVSPTTPFACAILTGCIAITLEIVDRQGWPPPTAWIAAVLFVLAVSGAKGTALPVLLAGWVSLLLMGLLLRRRVHWPVLLLLVFGTVVFVVAQRVIYGGTTQETTLLPFGLGDYLAKDAGMLPHPEGGSFGLRATLTIIYFLLRCACLAAVAGLFTRKVWRSPMAHFLVGSVVGGAGAMFLFDSATRNQVYFLLVTPPFIAVATGWGLVELVRRVTPRVAARVVVAFTALGLAVSALLLWPLRPGQFQDHDVHLASYVREPLIVVALLVVVSVGVWFATRRRRGWRNSAALACVSTVLGMSMMTGPLHALDVSATLPAEQLPSTNPTSEIAPGGIVVARWLRDHSSPDTEIATNSHCRFPLPRRCDHRAAWIAAYTERQVFIEGWAYTSQTAARAAKVHISTPFLGYWKPSQLLHNEQAFGQPSAEHMAWLWRQGVRWLLVDKRYRARVPAMARFAELKRNTEYYAVLKLTPPAGQAPGQ